MVDVHLITSLSWLLCVLSLPVILPDCCTPSGILGKEAINQPNYCGYPWSQMVVNSKSAHLLHLQRCVYI